MKSDMIANDTLNGKYEENETEKNPLNWNVL